jgi:hypothetical protein
MQIGQQLNYTYNKLKDIIKIRRKYLIKEDKGEA